MIDITMHTQPDDASCGPTSLHALYNYFGKNIELDEVVNSVERCLSGGTLAPMLGKHALQHGFSAIIYVNNVNMFDPTWFDPAHEESAWENLPEKLAAQMKHKTEMGFQQESQAYLEFMELGGEVRFRTLSVHLLKRYFLQNIPILTGLSATYLYRCPRELYTEGGEALYDDIRGVPCGHFVVLCGYDQSKRHIVVADPHRANPISYDNHYRVSSIRLINAILLGVLTYDANLLIIQPRQ